MKLFHLAENDGYERIVASTSDRVANAIIPRVPKQSFGEDQNTKRVCLAPSVLQCAGAIPRTGKLYIYEANTDCFSSPIGGTADISCSDEKWITDFDLKSAGDEIIVARIGWIDTFREYPGNDFKIRIKLAARENLNDADCWEKEEAGEWVLKDLNQPQPPRKAFKRLILPGDREFH